MDRRQTTLEISEAEWTVKWKSIRNADLIQWDENLDCLFLINAQ